MGKKYSICSEFHRLLKLLVMKVPYQEVLKFTRLGMKFACSLQYPCLNYPSTRSRNYFGITLPFKIMVSMLAVSSGNTGAINVVHVIEGNLIGWVCSPKVANWYTKSTNVTRSGFNRQTRWATNIVPTHEPMTRRH